MQMRLRMLKHDVGKSRHVMKQLHVCLRMLLYYSTTGYRARGVCALQSSGTIFVFCMLIFMSHVKTHLTCSWSVVALVQSLLAALDHLQTTATGFSGFPILSFLHCLFQGKIPSHWCTGTRSSANNSNRIFRFSNTIFPALFVSR